MLKKLSQNIYGEQNAIENASEQYKSNVTLKLEMEYPI
jgi:hypothetical protein